MKALYFYHTTPLVKFCYHTVIESITPIVRMLRRKEPNDCESECMGVKSDSTPEHLDS
jgi:hypothetical protein